MESSGEAGKVNISGSTYELVKDKFNCIHRGKIQAKNKGEIDMYFVESIFNICEIFNNIHEKQHTREILNAVRMELIDNKKREEEQYQYHLQVLKNIDSALANPTFQQQFVNNGIINPDIIAPDGVSSVI